MTRVKGRKVLPTPEEAQKRVPSHSPNGVVKGRNSTENHVHSFAEGEVSWIVDLVNAELKNNPYIQHLIPVSNHDQGLDLTHKFKDGLIFGALIQMVDPEAINFSKLNQFVSKGKLSDFEMRENNQACLTAAANLGVKLAGVHASTLMEGENYGHVIVGLCWQLFRMAISRKFFTILNETNQKLALVGKKFFEEDENDRNSNLDDLDKRSESLLLRWINSILSKSPVSIVKNFGSDLSNAKAFLVVEQNIWDKDLTREELIKHLNNSDVKRRADLVVKVGEDHGIKKVASSESILGANQKLNLLFTAKLFEKAAEKMISDEKDLEDLLLRWLNSKLVQVGLRQVSNVGSDLRDGREFLAVTSLALKDSGALQNLDKLSISERFDFVSKSVNQLGIDRKCSTAEFLNGDANYNRRVLYFLKNYIDHNASNYSVLLNQSRSTAEKGYRVPFLAKTTYPLWYKSASLLFGNSFYNVPAYSGEEESFLA